MIFFGILGNYKLPDKLLQTLKFIPAVSIIYMSVKEKVDLNSMDNTIDI